MITFSPEISSPEILSQLTITRTWRVITLNAIPASEHTEYGANIMDVLSQTFNFEAVYSQRQRASSRTFISPRATIFPSPPNLTRRCEFLADFVMSCRFS